MDGNTWENCGEDMAQKLYGSPGHIGHLGLLQESCAHTQPGIRCCRILWLNAEAYDLYMCVQYVYVNKYTYIYIYIILRDVMGCTFFFRNRIASYF